jgi:Tol biopolymer transport system component
MKRPLLLLIFVACFSFAAEAQNYTIDQYLSIKAASAPTFSPDGTRIAFLSNHTGTSQVWTVLMPTGNPRQLTNYDDNVSFVTWLADGSGLVFGKAKGGDENTQFYWMRPDGTGVRALTTDPTVRHNFGAVSWDGKTLWYASNKRNRTFFDIYSMDVASGREELQYQKDGNNDVAAVNDSGTKFIVHRDGTDLSLDDSLYLIDTRTKAEVLLTPHEGAVEHGNVNFVADGIVLTHNQGREFQNLAQMRRKNAASDDWSLSNLVTDVLDKTPWDVSGVEMSTYGNTMVYFARRV